MASSTRPKIRRRQTFCAVILAIPMLLVSSSSADLVVDYSGIGGSSWAINPNNAIGVRFNNTGSSFAVDGVQIFVGTSASSAVTADVSILQFDSMSDTSGIVLGTVNGVSITAQFPTDFATQSVFVDVSSLGLSMSNGIVYGIVVHNPSAGFLVGAVDNSDPEADVASITTGTNPGNLSGPAGQDMAFQAFGTVAVPEPVEVILFGIWVGVLFTGGNWLLKKRFSRAKIRVRKQKHN